MYSENDVNVSEEWCYCINEWCQSIITLNKRVLIFWHHFGYLNTTLRLDWHPLAESGKNLSLAPSLAPIRASICCKRARTSEKRSITTQLRRPPICADHPPALTTQLRWPPSCVDHSPQKKGLLPLSCADHPPAPTRKSRPHSTQSKKPSPFNPAEKAVPIQPR